VTTGRGLATAIALITCREYPEEVTRAAVLEGCDLAEVLEAMEEIACLQLSRLTPDERNSQIQLLGLIAAANVAAASDADG
jgi:hypothetical protein